MTVTIRKPMVKKKIMTSFIVFLCYSEYWKYKNTKNNWEPKPLVLWVTGRTNRQWLFQWVASSSLCALDPEPQMALPSSCIAHTHTHMFKLCITLGLWTPKKSQTWLFTWFCNMFVLLISSGAGVPINVSLCTVVT